MFIHYTRDAESPRSYFTWTALSTISAVLRSNVYQEWQYSKLYPNIFVLLIGPPAVGKALPMKLSAKMLKEIPTVKVIEGSASMQAVIKILGAYEGGQKGASCILYAEELSSFYVEDKKTNDLLTDLSDYHEKWERNLISWNATLKDVCICMLAGSNETLLGDIFDQRAIYGGLLSRTFVILEKKKFRRDALIRKNIEVKTDDWALMVNHLKKLSKVHGEIIFEEAALQEFEHWYEVQWEEFENNPRTRTGIEGRMKTHVKKVAILLAMCEEKLEMLVRRKHVSEAIGLCVGLYKNYQILSMEAPQAVNGVAPAAILLKLLQNAEGNELSRVTILQRNLGDLNPEVLDSCVIQLNQAELLVEVNDGNKIMYRLTSGAKQLYQDAKVKVTENEK
jgi:hypothetical protein